MAIIGRTAGFGPMDCLLVHLRSLNWVGPHRGEEDELWRALKLGNAHRVQRLLSSERTVAVLGLRGAVGETILCWTVLHMYPRCSPDHRTFVLNLIAAYPELVAEPYSGDLYKGETLLHLAAVHGDLELVRILVEQYNADFASARATGSFFARRGRVYFGETVLNFAVSRGFYDVVEYLLQAGADPNASDTHENTPLHFAVIHNQPRIYHLLLSYHADPTYLNRDLYSPLTLSIKYHRPVMFDEILSSTTQINWRWAGISNVTYPLIEWEDPLPLSLTTTSTSGTNPLDATLTGASFVDTVGPATKAATAGLKLQPKRSLRFPDPVSPSGAADHVFPPSVKFTVTTDEQQESDSEYDTLETDSDVTDPHLFISNSRTPSSSRSSASSATLPAINGGSISDEPRPVHTSAEPSARSSNRSRGAVSSPSELPSPRADGGGHAYPPLLRLPEVPDPLHHRALLSDRSGNASIGSAISGASSTADSPLRPSEVSAASSIPPSTALGGSLRRSSISQAKPPSAATLAPPGGTPSPPRASPAASASKTQAKPGKKKPSPWAKVRSFVKSRTANLTQGLDGRRGRGRVTKTTYKPSPASLELLRQRQPRDRKVLPLLIHFGRDDMVFHPVTMQILQLKWYRFGRIRFFKSLCADLMFLILFTIQVGLFPGKLSGGYFEASSSAARFRIALEFINLLICICFIALEVREGLSSTQPLRDVLISSLTSTQVLHSLFLLLIPSAFVARLSGAEVVERCILAAAIIAGWCSLLYYARGLQSLGPLVITIWNVLVRDLVRFSAIFVIFAVAFAQALHVCVKFRDVEGYDWWLTALIEVFAAGTGVNDFDYKDLGPTVRDGGYVMAVLVFIVFDVVVIVLMLNMLIAMMNNTYQDIADNAQRQWALQWASIILDAERKLDIRERVRLQIGTVDKYGVRGYTVMLPFSAATVALWDGFVAQLRDTLLRRPLHDIVPPDPPIPANMPNQTGNKFSLYGASHDEPALVRQASVSSHDLTVSLRAPSGASLGFSSAEPPLVTPVVPPPPPMTPHRPTVRASDEYMRKYRARALSISQLLEPS
ncbi:uncharacterized protein AMSG_04363 [Thecamonas trahens ATCC 50062]|uniref:Polycystin cation channel PKD1/PKD2 domain-containing protein n=1 Tax=Thecamonas trahens ATCC 50062 TaxID=461836 RepID=A0A0L0DA19_THETB|nr:hypothetical protein AMSG_04363 [Thecamonas trahens ATCC 50062]KNC48133.1 hypothetical protein AMSG_04363 [Thecamonas trahens ATCC 50062]|eukprot:XP_013758704.1 hypothetical protein AMSG_04363 [Thecamonas trahens ATCC 50062]